MSIPKDKLKSSTEAPGFLYVQVEDTCLPKEWIRAVQWITAAEHRILTEQARREEEFDIMVRQNPVFQEQVGMAIAWHNKHCWRA